MRHQFVRDKPAASHKVARGRGGCEVARRVLQLRAADIGPRKRAAHPLLARLMMTMVSGASRRPGKTACFQSRRQRSGRYRRAVRRIARNSGLRGCNGHAHNRSHGKLNEDAPADIRGGADASERWLLTGCTSRSPGSNSPRRSPRRSYRRFWGRRTGCWSDSRTQCWLCGAATTSSPRGRIRVHPLR